MGDCYKTNFTKFFKENNPNWILVHALREWGGVGSEVWGSHCFILDTLLDKVYDYSLSASQWNIGSEGIPKDMIYKEWNIQEDGLYMYFEYTRKEAVVLTYEKEHYGPFEILFDDWQHESWGYYMKEYFVPKFQPKKNLLDDVSEVIKEEVTSE